MPNTLQRRRAAEDLLDDFADRTGVASDAAPRRYLWTDAFAVCTWLGLHETTGQSRFLDLARTLVDQVHRVLGRHRDDDPRRGWISGLDEATGARHPTAGGLRIGKPLPERGPGAPHDPRREWDRDGQYHHYLTRWMHALARTARVTGESPYHLWAAELARAAHRGFRHRAADGVRLHWKMSVDLSRPLVASMGHHDPLDGLVAALSLQGSAVRDPRAPDLEEEVAELERLCAGRSWATDDPLGIGGLVADALFLGRLAADGRGVGGGLLESVVDDAVHSMRAVSAGPSFQSPAEGRLAFRELGLAVGLHAAGELERLVEGGRLGADPGLAEGVRRLASAAPAAGEIEAFWMDPGARSAASWTGHEDINAVTLATSLAPEGYLGG